MSAPVNLVAPATLEEAGLSLDLVTQLALKTLYFAGELSGSDIARRMGVSFGVVEPALDFLKVQHRCEIVGGAIAGGSSYRYRITTDGRSVAALFLQQSQYILHAPLSLHEPLANSCSIVAKETIRDSKTSSSNPSFPTIH